MSDTALLPEHTELTTHTTYRLSVSVFSSLHDSFDYSYQGPLPPLAARVKISLRNKPSIGVITEINTGESQGQYELKPIEEIIDNHGVLTETLLQLAPWCANYYQSSLSEVLKNIIPKRLRTGHDFTPSKRVKSPTILDDGQEKQTPLTVNPEQAEALATFKKNQHHFQQHLLFGITGSGKTEVYLQAMAGVLSSHQQVLLLVPEIGLTPALVERVVKRFSCPITLIHSKLSDGERHKAYIDCFTGHARIVIGTRSAVFAPLKELGLIVIDEEHDLSFKQQDGMRYHARDVAIKRAQLENIPIIMGSATPSLESYYNTRLGRSLCLRLTEVAEAKAKRQIEIIDCRTQALTHGLTDSALTAIRETLEKERQVLVFINRRGFSPILMCHQCAYSFVCPHCDTYLTYHQGIRKLKCHHCLYAKKEPNSCPSCNAKSLLNVGYGTERVGEHLQSCFRDKTVLRVDRDSMSQKKAFAESLAAISNGEADILVGTQMLAKGHHFPRLQLVIILDIDGCFYSTDFRSRERLAQLISQVSGRTGRVEDGRVLLQTHHATDSFFPLLLEKGYHGFLKEELSARERLQQPPFAPMALIRAKGKQQPAVLKALDAFKQALKTIAPTLTLLGPATAPIEKKANAYHCQLLIKAPDRKTLHIAIARIRQQHRHPNRLNGIAYSIDIDCQELA